MKREIHSIEDNRIWEKGKVSEEAEILTTKPFKEKTQDKFKAHLVVGGCAVHREIILMRYIRL